MTRIILYSAGEADGDRVRRQLAHSRRMLARAGIALPGSDDPGQWTRLGRHLLRGANSDRTNELLAVARRDGVIDVVVCSADPLDRVIDRPGARRLNRWARARDVDVTVAVTITDQLVALNTAYCRDVLRLDWARSFEEFVEAPKRLPTFDVSARLGPLLDGPVQLVPLRVDDVGADPVTNMLSAVGVEEDRLHGLRLVSPGEVVPQPGPVLVAAVRLLHRRMRRLGMFAEQRALDALLELVDELSQHARAHEWDAEPFWGWSAASAAAIRARFEQSNTEFAARAWSTNWSPALPTRGRTVVDLPTERPALVVDVLDTVDSLVNDLRRGSGTAEPTASAG